MTARRFYHSLRFKITVGVAVPLLIILTTISYLQYNSHRDLMLENLRLSASNTGDIIEASLQHAMLTNDFSEVQQIVDEIAKREGIRDLFLLDKQGRIVMSAMGRQVGTVLSLDDPTCQACHQHEIVNRNLSMVFTSMEGERVFRNLNPIDNREDCQSCHNPQDKLSGVLITDFSMADIDRHLAMDRRNNFLWSAGTIGVTVLIVGLMMNRLVVTRLERFTQTVRSLGKGNQDQRVVLGGNDEIGELANSFNSMYEELGQKESLRGQLMEKVITAQEEERRRIARELHDETGQALTSLMVGLKVLAGAASLQEVQEKASQLRAVAAQTLDSVHRLALELRPSVLDDLGLVAAIQRHVKDWGENCGLRADFQAIGPDRRLSPQIETTVYRVVQEALTNVARHAEAQNVSVILEYRGDSIVCIIEDDGQGFDVTRVLKANDMRRLGLYGMQERISLVGGKLAVESTAGVGTTVFVEIPLDVSPQSE